MPNMGYCRFENTLDDLLDCLDHFEDELSESEAKARKGMVDAAIDIIERLGGELRDDGAVLVAADELPSRE